MEFKPIDLASGTSPYLHPAYFLKGLNYEYCQRKDPLYDCPKQLTDM
jgi:hypothetical protein